MRSPLITSTIDNFCTMESGASGLNESTNEAATVSNDLKNGAAS